MSSDDDVTEAASDTAKEESESSVIRSCKNCPSFLRSDKVAGQFAAATGMDHCARFGTILGMPGMHPRQAEGLRRHTAERCVHYGMPAPTGVVNWEEVAPKATLPSRAAIMREQSRKSEEREDVFSCKDCVFYNRYGAEQQGMRNGAICSARGEFIFDYQVGTKGRSCGSAMKVDWQQSNRTQIREPVHLNPALVDAFYKVMTPLERWRANKASFVDPSKYATNRKVTKEDQDRGVRAWRELVDDETGNSVYMPIYDMEKLPKELRELVPQTGDDEHPESFIDYDGLTYMLAALWYELDETPTLWGFPGTGKTEVLRHMAWLMQLPFHRLQRGQVSRDDGHVVGDLEQRQSAHRVVVSGCDEEGVSRHACPHS